MAEMGVELLGKNIKIDKVLCRQGDEPMKGLPFKRPLEKVDKEDPIVEMLVRVHEECSQVLVRVLGAVVQPVLRRLETHRELDRRKFAICHYGLYLS